MAVVLTLVQTKQIIINIHKQNNTKKHSTNNTKTIYASTHNNQIPTHYKTHNTHIHTLQKLKQPQYEVHTKWSSYNKIKYLQYKITLMYKVPCPQQLHRNSLHINHVSSLHITSLHLFTLIPQLKFIVCNYIHNPLSNLFILLEKDASKPAGNLFQHLMVLFTK